MMSEAGSLKLSIQNNMILMTSVMMKVISLDPKVIIFTKLQGLRKKYDAEVEYTVHLTAQRDTIVSQLELNQRELMKEKSSDRNNP